jgi:hypothetical protein
MEYCTLTYRGTPAGDRRCKAPLDSTLRPELTDTWVFWKGISTFREHCQLQTTTWYNCCGFCLWKQWKPLEMKAHWSRKAASARPLLWFYMLPEHVLSDSWTVPQTPAPYSRPGEEGCSTQPMQAKLAAIQMKPYGVNNVVSA